ncbi:DUF1653 domain-containing protein [Moraxella nasovis]|uniref:DUF1653 domain-containing protein n=1 Tax=Moraxella nasovis TaxID=2904121 RepID=UPI001F609BB7|nr:DUF1653 domain-containing protein [Moraxella nasovis]UNU74199.1 DUF1653 domain-containing protein [Moraxella nasovis]
MNNANLKTGIYRHYKGKEYQVLHIAHHSKTKEMLVVYRALYGERGVWVRPLAMFCEMVNINGQDVPRFKLIKELSC